MCFDIYHQKNSLYGTYFGMYSMNPSPVSHRSIELFFLKKIFYLSI